MVLQNEGLFKAIEIIAEEVIKKNSNTITIKGIIKEKILSSDGYRIDYQNTTIMASSLGQAYQQGDEVYILLPNGVLQGEKFILGKTNSRTPSIIFDSEGLSQDTLKMLQEINEKIKSLTSDGVLYPSEKIVLQGQWELIKKSYEEIHTMYLPYKDDINIKPLEDAYGPLETIMEEILSDMATESYIDSTLVNNTMEFYLKEDSNTRKKIAEELRKELVYKVEVISTNGTTFKNGIIETKLRAIIYQGKKNKTVEIPASAIRWHKSDLSGEPIPGWKKTGHEITVTTDDISTKEMFVCEIHIDEALVATDIITLIDIEDVGLLESDLEVDLPINQTYNRGEKKYFPDYLEDGIEITMNVRFNGKPITDFKNVRFDWFIDDKKILDGEENNIEVYDNVMVLTDNITNEEKTSVLIKCNITYHDEENDVDLETSSFIANTLVIDGDDAILHTAYSWSQDGSDRFTFPYPGENLWVKKNIKDGFYIDGKGNLIPWQYTNLCDELIKITSNIIRLQYFNRKNIAPTDPNGRLNFYDKDKKFISQTERLQTGTSDHVSFPIVPPKEAVYFNSHTPKADGLDVKIEQSPVYTMYTPSPKDDPENAHPKFMGTYNSNNKKQSDNYQDYEWARITGADSHLKTAYSWSADGSDRFTTEYPNENLIQGGTLEDFVVKNYENKENISKPFTQLEDISKLKGKTVTISCKIDAKNVKKVNQSYFRAGWEISIVRENGAMAYIGSWQNFSVEGQNFTGYIEKTVEIPSDALKWNSNGGRYIQASGEKVSVSEPKMEIGKTRTIYTTSEKESIDESYPKFIGTYVSPDKNQSLDYRDYEWARFSGENGITHTAYSWSADGTDRFTDKYPNENLCIGYSLQNMKEVKLTTSQYYIQEPTGFRIKPNVKYVFSIEGYSKENIMLYTNLGIGESSGNFNFDLTPNQQLLKSRTIREFSVTQAQIDTYGDFLTYRIRNDQKVLTAVYGKVKLEEGSKNTIYTTPPNDNFEDAWPTFSGTYNSYDKIQSQDPKDYTWTRIRGESGKDGKDGVTPKDVIHGYLTNDSLVIGANYQGVISDYSQAIGEFVVYEGQTKLTSGVVYTKISEIGMTSSIDSTGKYKVTALNQDMGSTIYRATYKGVSIDTIMMVVKNKQGNPGANGNGISTTKIEYAPSTSGTTAPTSGWTAGVPTVAENQFLWTRTIITYSNGTSTTSYSVGKMGKNGTNGTNGTNGKNGDPTGVIVSATEPNPKFANMLWKNTGTSGGRIKDVTYRWTGSSWEIFTFSAKNMVVDNLAAINANLGNITAGNIKGVNIEGTTIKGGTITGTTINGGIITGGSFKSYLETSIFSYSTVLQDDLIFEGKIKHNNWNFISKYRYNGSEGTNYDGNTLKVKWYCGDSGLLYEEHNSSNKVKFNITDSEFNLRWGDFNFEKDDLKRYNPTQLSPASGFSIYSNSEDNLPTVERFGRTVRLSGAFRNNNNMAKGWSGNIGYIPVWARPSVTHRAICQGSGSNTFHLHIKPTGELFLERYGTNDFNAFNAGAWLTINCIYTI